MTATQPEGLDMASLTDEQIIALADQHAFDTDKRVLQFARALLSAVPAQSAETIYQWRTNNGDNEWQDVPKHYFDTIGPSFRRIVYTAPQPSPTAVVLDDGCPHAAPFRYCPKCPVTPCPIGLGEK